jgi:aminoglycoside phosphotransferase (APT) family kinase protein
MSDHSASPILLHPEMPANSSIDAADVSVSSSDASTTSTEVFEHEPFSTFQSKVIDLCKENWPHLSTKAFEVTRMEGGSYNRVIGVSVDVSKTQLPWYERHAKQLFQQLCFIGRRKDKTKSKVREYVIRMPRYEHAWFEQEVAILLFLATTNVPAPKIKSFGLSTANPLSSRFTIQPRIPGKSVHDVYLDLNTSQRISFARDLGLALKEMGKIRAPCPGTLDPDSILNGSQDVKILRVQCPPRNAPRPPSTEAPLPSTLMSVYDLITSQLARQREYDISLHRESLNPWKPFRAIIDELHAQGLFDDIEYYLTHMDFEPRNILLHTTSPTTACLSAILDWDEALFAPALLNCRPPSWLWDFEGDDDEELDESVAGKTPEDPDLAAVKAAFEDVVGEQYLKYAYEAEYRIAQDITRLAVQGIGSNEDYEAAEKVLREWGEMYPGIKIRGMEE